MDADSPWARKIGRAEKHLAELKTELAAYESGDRYVAVRDRDTDPDPGVWMYRAKLVDQPSKDLPLIIGDIVHNLRASLDHVVAALVPAQRQRRAKFPIVHEDFWRTDPHTGEHVDRSGRASKARSAYKDALRGVPTAAQQKIAMIQPFRFAVDSMWLSELHSLDIADKHYSLLTLPHGIDSPVTEISLPAYSIQFSLRGMGVCLNGEVVTLLPSDLQAHPLNRRLMSALAVPDTEVNVKLTGTPKVGLKVPDVSGEFVVPETIEQLVTQVWALTDMLGWHVPPNKA